MKKYYENESNTLFCGDSIKILKKLQEKSIDMVFTDPPYFLSNDGITCSNGKMVSVNKGEWDKSRGFNEDVKFHKKWIKECDRVLKDDGSIWISGTYHCIHQIIYILLSMGYYIINEVTWFKPNAAPNLGCRCLTASHETLIWAKKSKKARHTFNYDIAKEINGGKQMRSVWEISTTPKSEKINGNHPTQKPLKLMERIIRISTNPGDIILDPFCGSSSTGVAANKFGRKYIGVDISEEFLEISKKRIEELNEGQMELNLDLLCKINIDNTKEENSIKMEESMISKEAKPFLKWAGGKAKLIPIFEERYPVELQNGEIDTYIEPFIGGGAVLLSIISKYNFNKIVINDINSELTLTYKVIREYPDKLISILDKMQEEYNCLDSLEEKQEFFYGVREKFNQSKGNINYEKIDDKSIEHAASMIFLNKSCFNGLYRENKKGGFNVPFGKKEKLNCYDKENIMAVSEKLKNAIILNGDFEKVMDYVNNHTFVYMDPPYRPLNATSNFNDYSKEPFNDDTQIRLSKFYKELNKKGAKLMESNSDPKNTDENDEFFDELYSDYKVERIYAARSINSKGTGRGKVSEILITNY
ncbi:Dam family site-specific DNA-(adenine-N6)-methyltransferase [Clostridium saudiense]|uniref:Dam family site-specific DNA-(adenine-N6)-methyltransferase n=1 Tax=Clostridium saudiense TaxID=1414720 RepID=UPI00311B3BB3